MRAIRQKPNKPLAVDARCLLRAIDAVAASKSLKQAWLFLVNHTITPPGSCIHRKAINKDKPSLSSGVLPSRQQYHIGVNPGTPPPSVYQVTHGTALQAAECHVSHFPVGMGFRGLPHARQNGLFLFIALERMVTFCKEGAAHAFGLGVKSSLL